METPFKLVFMGTTNPSQPVDPETFEVVIHYREVWPAEDDCMDDWQAMDAWGRGQLCRGSEVFCEENLGRLMRRLATAGFRNVSVDLSAVPHIPPRQPNGFDKLGL